MARKTRKPESDRLDVLEGRLSRMEEFCRDIVFHIVPREFVRVHAEPPQEEPIEPWKHLVRRRHPWRRQLYIKGRNMTARQLVGSMKANHFDEEGAAADLHVPVEAVREALAYVEKNKDLLETEAEIERLMLKRGGVVRGPQPVS